MADPLDFFKRTRDLYPGEDEYFKALADYFCIDAETVRDISKDVAKENYLTELIDKIEIHVGGFGK